MTYSAKDDLMVGDIPMPASLDPQRFVDDASDEVDSIIGFRYQTPIDVSDSSLVIRPARLLLKRVANFLASGRLMEAAAAGSEDKQVHAYAKSLIDQALYCLEEIVKGAIILEGALPQGDVNPTGPMIYNKDIESAVDAFYDRIVAPDQTTSLVRVSPTVLLW